MAHKPKKKNPSSSNSVNIMAIRTTGDVSLAFKGIIDSNCTEGSKQDEAIVGILSNELQSVRQLQGQCSQCSTFAVLKTMAFFVAPFLFLLVLANVPLYLILIDSPCLAALGPLGELVVSEPFDCQLCANLTEVPRLSNLDVNEFFFKYHMSNVPIIVTDATQSWSAMEEISYQYLRDLYNNHSEAFDYDSENGQFFKYSSDLDGLEDVFNLTEERASMNGKRWYIGWSTSDPSISIAIKKHFSSPYFLSPQPVIENRLAWIFMGSPGPGAYMHLDSVQFSSWQAQLKGKKTWMLSPYPDCEHICHSMNATMNTGDMIVVDTNRWVHGTYIHPEGISITVGTEFE